MLFKPDIVNSDPELGEKIRLLPKEDFYIVADDFRNLEMLLQVNPDNRIAFEYKIARLLLEKDLMAVGSEVKRLKGMGYGKISQAYRGSSSITCKCYKGVSGLRWACNQQRYRSAIH